MKFNLLAAVLLVTAVLSASPVAAQDFALGADVIRTGEIWEINLTTLATSFVTDTGINDAGDQPNAQAWDDVNKRFYYATPLAGNLFVWEQTTAIHTFLGNIKSGSGIGGAEQLSSAAFYAGEYYFIVDGTDDLWRITFSEGPLAIVTITKVGDMNMNQSVWFFGDIAINSSGILYGIAALQVPIVEVEFFSYDLDLSTFNSIKTEAQSTDPDYYTLAQITFNTPVDDTLYAFTTTGVTTADNGEVFTDDLASGDYTLLGIASPLVRFRDIAGATRSFNVVPFECTDEPFVVFDQNSQLNQIDLDLNQNTFTFNNIANPINGLQINNLGFRSTDGLLYGWERNGADTGGQIVQIDSTSAVTGLGQPIPPLPANQGSALNYNAGDVSVDGTKMYLTYSQQNGDGGKLYIVDLTSTTPLPRTEMDITGDSGNVADWAAHPTNGLLYGGDHDHLELASLDPTTGARTDVDIGLPDDGSRGYGAAWFNASGRLFLYHNSGKIYAVDDVDTSPTLVGTPYPLVNTALDTTNNDGAANCSAAIDISKTPDSQTVFTGDDVTFTIVVTNTGDVDLTNVMVSDPLAPDCDMDIGDLIGDLAVDEIVSYECTIVMVTVSFTNVATATGNPADGGTEVSDMDTAGVIVEALAQHTLTLASAGTGSGNTTGAGTHDFGTDVVVTATADLGSTFVGWSGADGTECTTGTVDMVADKSCTATFDLIDVLGPVTSNVIIPNTAAVNTDLVLMAEIDDSATEGSDIAVAEYSIDGGQFIAMTAVDGAFDSVIEDATVSVSAFTVAGVYEVCVRGTDVVGNVGEPECLLLAIYDPDGGFVTGGGVIDSPEGAYVADPALAGKAKFGFVSKYKKGATVPTGQTQFQFKVADLNFHSSTYEWLVVAGAKAMYKGSGTINGTGNYGFLLFALDAALTPSQATDLFRIQIWDKNNADSVVYDNELGTLDDADPTTKISGGNILIHTK